MSLTSLLPGWRLLASSKKEPSSGPVHVPRCNTIAETAQKIADHIQAPTGSPSPEAPANGKFFHLAKTIGSAQKTQRRITLSLSAKFRAAHHPSNSSDFSETKHMESIVLNLDQVLREDAAYRQLCKSNTPRSEECGVLLSALVLLNNIIVQSIMLQGDIKNLQLTLMSITHYQTSEVIQQTVKKILFLIRQLGHSFAVETTRQMEEWGQLGKDLKQWGDETKAIELSAKQAFQDASGKLFALGLSGSLRPVSKLAALFPSFFGLSLYIPEEVIEVPKILRTAPAPAGTSARGKASEELLRNNMASEMAKRIVFAIIDLLTQRSEPDVRPHIYQIATAIERIRTVQTRVLKMLVNCPLQIEETRAIIGKILETSKEMKAEKTHFIGQFDSTDNIPSDLAETAGAVTAQAILTALLHKTSQKEQKAREQKKACQELRSFLREVEKKMEYFFSWLERLHLLPENPSSCVSANALNATGAEETYRQIRGWTHVLAVSEMREHLKHNFQIINEKLNSIILSIDTMIIPDSITIENRQLSTNLEDLELQISKAKDQKKALERVRMEMYGTLC